MKRFIYFILFGCIISASCFTFSSCALLDSAVGWMTGDGEYVNFGDSRIGGNDAGYYIGIPEGDKADSGPSYGINSDIPREAAYAPPPGFFSSKSSSQGQISGKDLINKEGISLYDAAEGMIGEGRYSFPTKSSNLSFPLRSNSTITSFFGWRNLSGNMEYHNGVDLVYSNNSSKTIYASGSGRVIEDKWIKGYGNVLIIQYENLGGDSPFLLQANEILTLIDNKEGGSDIFTLDSVEQQRLLTALEASKAESLAGQKTYLTQVLNAYYSNIIGNFPTNFSAKDYPSVVAFLLDLSIVIGDSQPIYNYVANEVRSGGGISALETAKKAAKTWLENNTTSLGFTSNSSYYTYLQKRIADAASLYKDIQYLGTFDNSKFIEAVLDCAAAGRPVNKFQQAGGYGQVFGIMEVKGEENMELLFARIAEEIGKKGSSDVYKVEYTFLYAHLASSSVKKNSSVSASDVIAIMGNTGGDWGVHLHLSTVPGLTTNISDFNYHTIDINAGLVKDKKSVNPLSDAFCVNSAKEAQDKFKFALSATTISEDSLLDGWTGKKLKVGSNTVTTTRTQAENMWYQNRTWGLANLVDYNNSN